MKNLGNSKHPRILIISNNSFSSTTNNGKTLASFFDKYPIDNIAQLYFNSEIPKDVPFNNFFRISDIDIIKSVIKRNDLCGEKIYKVREEEKEEKEIKVKRSRKVIKRISKYDSAKLTREKLWGREKWKTVELDKWLGDFSPEIIFFCAGDSGFAYNITEYIKTNFKTKLITYITDDYILPRRTISPFWWARRNLIFKKMKRTVQKSDLFITISQQMSDKYKELFEKESILAVNMSDSLKDITTNEPKNEKIVLVYTGGLHIKRYETLILLANSLKNYNLNEKNKQKAYLEIYSGQKPSDSVINKLNIEGASQFLGNLNPNQLKKVLNSTNIPVHVESFSKKSIEITRLSVSTKISEYLSLGKPILAIGPSEVASMKYLEDSAFCIISEKEIESQLEKFLRDNNLQKVLANKAEEKYEINHKKDIVSKKLLSEILHIHNK